MKAPTVVTRDTLKQMLLNSNPRYVEQVIGRALVQLLNRQTESEQVNCTTDDNNGVGFTGSDAKCGTLTAKFFLKHKYLTQWQVDKWSKQNMLGYPRLSKYHKQLNEVAVKNQK